MSNENNKKTENDDSSFPPAEIPSQNEIISQIKNQNENKKISQSIQEKPVIIEEIQTKKHHYNKQGFLQYLDSLDKKISFPLQTYTPRFPIECIFYCFARLFNPDLVIIYFASVLIFSIIRDKNGYLVLYPIAHVLTGLIITVILKKIIGRPRPTLKTYRYFRKVREKEFTYSMPSGDSLQAAIFSTMIILYINSFFSYFSILLIPAAMIGRVFYNCHYWFDTIIGAILGVITSICTYFTILKIFH